MTSLNFGIGRSGTGTRQWQWRSSADNYSAPISIATLATGLTQSSGVITNPDANSSWIGNVIQFSGAPFGGLTAITFRVYSYNSEGSAGTAGLQGALTFSGTVNGTATTPAAPVVAAATGNTTTGFTANWAVSSGATKYYLDVATDSGFTTFVTGYQNKDVGNVTSSAVTGLDAGTTYYYRVRANNSAGTSADSQIQVVLTASASAPVINVSSSSLSGFAYNGTGPSTAQSISVTASNLTGEPGSLSVSGSANYEVSTISATDGFGSSVLVSYTTATLNATNVWIRLKAGLVAGNYNAELISISGGGAASAATVSVSGSVTVPVISVTTTNLGSFIGTNGVGSAAKTNTITGTSLAGNVTMVATNYFQLSSDAGSTYTNTLTLNPTAGALTNAVLFRIAPDAPVGNLGTNLVTISSLGAADKTVQVSGVVVYGGVTMAIAGLSTATVVEGAADLILDVTLSVASPAGGTTVTLTTSDTDSSELGLSTTSVVFAAGETTKTVNLTPKTDGIFDADRTIVITATAPDWSVAGTVSVKVTNTEVMPISYISLTSLNPNSYTQNFDALGTASIAGAISSTAGAQSSIGAYAESSTLNGWYATKVGGTSSTATAITADTGSTSSGLVYNYGAASETDRALGVLASGSNWMAIGALIKNDTGGAIDGIKVSFTAEFWRSSGGTSSVQNVLACAIGKVGGGTITTANFLTAGSAAPFISGNITGPAAVTASAALNGNDVANQSTFTDVVIPLVLAAGETGFVRWSDVNDGGDDAGLAIDNLKMTAVVNSLPMPTITSISPTSVLRGSGNTPVTFTGTGYSSPKTTVSISGSALSLTNVSSNSLTANVTSNYFTTAGTLTMTLSNPTPGGGSVSTNLAVVTPLPTILGFSPASVVEGAGDTLVTVSGTGFFGDSVIRWNGTDLMTSYNSPNQLTTTIPAASLSSATLASVTVATPDAGDLFQESVVSTFEITSPTAPQVTPSVGTLSGFAAPVGTPSAEQSYTLQGQYLSSNVVLTAPDQFQISKTSGSEFGSSLDLTAGEVEAGVIIYVRYNPSAVSASHIGNISHVSDGAVTQNVEVTGNSQPTLTVDPTSVTILNGYGYVAGGQSGLNGDTPGFIVSGARLAEPVTVTAPANYGVSNDDGVTFARSVTLNPNGAGLVLSTLKIQFQPLGAVTADESVVVTAGLLTASLSANGRASALEENDLLTAQAGDQRVKLSWRSLGAGTQVIVLASIGSSISDVPSNVGLLTANAIYGQGSKEGSSYVVYKENQGPREPSASEKVTITGLANGQQYTFKVFVVNGDAVSAGTSAKSIPFGILSNVLTQWNFNGSTTTPSVGSGTAQAIGGTVIKTTYATGSPTDPLGAGGVGNLAWTLESWLGGSTETAGVQFNVSTVGKGSIVVSWDAYPSNTGPKYYRLLYTSDGSVATPVWTSYTATGSGTESGLYVNPAGASWTMQNQADLSGVPALQNNPNAAFRLVSAHAPGTSAYAAANSTSTAGSTGTLRFDMVTVSGVASVFNNPPTNITISATTIAENNAVNAVVGTLSTTDSDVGDSFTYSLVSGTGEADNGSFDISGSSLRAGVAFDYDTKSSYSIRVRTTDSSGGTFEKVFGITVTNVSDSPAEYKEDWLAENGLPSNSDFNSDPNSVGYSLATAYAFGLSPIVWGGEPVTLVSSPTGSVKVVYLRRDISSGVTYAVKTGTDLAIGLNGNDAIIKESVSQPSPAITGYTRYEATYTPSAPATKGFVKVQAIVP